MDEDQKFAIIMFSIGVVVLSIWLGAGLFYEYAKVARKCEATEYCADKAVEATQIIFKHE